MVTSTTLRDAFASLVGLALAAVGIWLLRDGIIHWPVASAAVLIGLYLTLPKRMRLVGDALVAKYKQFRGTTDD